MKLISMVEFINEIGNSTLHESYEIDLAKIYNYCTFLEQPLKLGMFVPCDEDGNVLTQCEEICACECDEIKNYRKAKEKVLFEEFEIATNKEGEKVILGDYTCLKVSDLENGTIEDLIKYVNIKLTKSAIKRIFG
jgi:hypothetical protein